MDSAELPSPIMYGAQSPIFDVPEFPSLRRVKPLPKRRRTSSAPSDAIPTDVAGMLPPMLPPLPGPDATAEELLAHAEELSAQMALQSYYMPIIGDMQDFIKNEAAYGERLGTPAIDYGAAYGGGEEDDQGDGDYVDHLQQPGNTKKRKVPANQSASQHGPDSADGQSGGEEEPADRAIPVAGRLDGDFVEAVPPSSDPGGAQRRGRMLPATLVGLQHKEILKNRKRQLAAVLGALSHGDTLALDQALSAPYPLLNSALGVATRASGIKPPLLRRTSRLARRHAKMTSSVRSENAEGCRFPSGEFTFVCHSATSDRLVATREEVAVLHARFEAELARQAAKAAEAAKQAAEAAKNASQGSARAQRKARTANQAPQTADPLAPGQTGGATKLRGKKKKRSALANASNPHHLRNYVPSRLPNQGQMNSAQATANAQNSLGPLPLQFLSAQIPPRRRKNNGTVPLVPPLVNPAEEWICPNCEYQLFYGDEQAYRRAVRNRKKILKRRRRARERAAAAASGANAAAAAAATDAGEEDVEEAFEGAERKGGPKAAQPKTVQEKEGDRGWGER